ncbi:BNR repeat-containing protein [Labilibaculum sp. DW002]|uniref:BNR repeat-containing protein n=1 Tax=Paralabilibaculum antarcticum TaxID=2912572 RepID=A0ABT5VP92_9BACT|nr:BNR-4 repeat-containing protein [Labilibaculum sp. DW002]MDE5417091.1 BNR repeat-containing protein [Labilibaculum sp. DW002]
MKMIKAILSIVCFLLLTSNLFAQQKTITDDGAWCWFSAPRAIYKHNVADEIATGWVSEDGSIISAILNLKSGEKKIQNVSSKLDKDDHANPSFLELKNGDVLMSYAKHMDTVVRFHHLNKGETEFSSLIAKKVLNKEQFKLYPRKCVTYVNPFQLKKENGRIYCFGRWTGFKPNVMWSDDNGKTFSDARVFITNKPFQGGNRPYVRYYSDGQSKIHIVFTDGHPRNEKNNSVYYACYEKGAFWRIDGTKICDFDQLPFEPKEASVVYKATEQEGRAWVYDINADKKGNPVILYARYPKETEHLYRYAQYVKGEWIDHELCNSGKWFPQTQEGKVEKEPHYSGGMCIHPLEANTIYISKDVNGIFEIEKRVTSDHGKSWDITPITQNSKYDNVRPVVPQNMKRGDKTVLLWMVNEKYVHYTNYKTRIDYTLD